MAKNTNTIIRKNMSALSQASDKSLTLSSQIEKLQARLADLKKKQDEAEALRRENMVSYIGNCILTKVHSDAAFAFVMGMAVKVEDAADDLSILPPAFQELAMVGRDYLENQKIHAPFENPYFTEEGGDAEEADESAEDMEPPREEAHE